MAPVLVFRRSDPPPGDRVLAALNRIRMARPFSAAVIERMIERLADKIAKEAA